MVSRIGLFVLCAAFATFCNAAEINYTVSQTIGTGSVTGTITTDGTIGSLDDVNVIDWNLLVDDGTTSFDLTGPLSGGNSGFFDHAADGSLSATATQLLFDFGDGSVANYFYFVNLTPDFPQYDWCFQAQNDCIFSPSAPSEAEGISFLTSSGVGDLAQFTGLSGSQIIGTSSSGSPSTPEPSTLALVLGGVVVIRLLDRWRTV